jgi:hypothetical protein
MVLVATNQNLIRDIAELLKTRGLRLAAHEVNNTATAVNSDYFVVYTHVTGGDALSAPSAGTQRIVIEFNTAALTTMDEKAFGSIHPHVPSTTRQ